MSNNAKIDVKFNVKFSMNTGPGGGQDIIREMAMPLVKKSAEAIAGRASSISNSITSQPTEFKVVNYIGLPNRRGGSRAVAAVVADGVVTDHQKYMGFTAVQKSKDAGRV